MKRSGFQRKPLVRQADTTARLTIKPKKCKACRAEFFPARQMQTVCTPDCAKALVEKKAAREAEQQRLAEVRKDKARREAIKTLPELKKEAQQEFNRWVRFRDHGKGCFVCDAPLRLGGIGGGFDAGHIRARSQADHLRYDERNVHGQCKPCNAAGATKDHVMRAAAERLLGKEAAAALYDDNRVIKWTREGLRQIRDTYRARANELEKKLR